MSDETSTTEKKRLNNLKSYRILDTPAEREYDELARLAASICETPMALITLVDEDRLWCKARVGTDLIELPRAQSFCTHAIFNDAPLIVSDTTFDTRFSSNPLVVGYPHIRFYAGFPLVSREGFTLGALCVFDQTPREINIRQMNSLKVLANQVVALFERNKYLHDLESQRLLLRGSAKLAALGQMAASIVHEINSPLSILQARASMLSILGREGKATPERTIESAEKMLETTRRMNKIIGGLSANLGNSDHESFREISLQSLIDDTLSFSSSRFLSGQIEFEYLKINDPIFIWCRPVQISQVLLNLLNNAFDATVISRAKRKWVKLEIRDFEDFVELQIVDCGKPLSPELVQKIFLPFFTTKEAGKGTGLGLSISDEIVNAHGGELKFEPNSKNTTFTVRLPKRNVVSDQMATRALVSGQ